MDVMIDYYRMDQENRDVVVLEGPDDITIYSGAGTVTGPIEVV